MYGKIRRVAILSVVAAMAALTIAAALPTMASAEQASTPYTTRLSASAAVKAIGADAPNLKLAGVRPRTATPVITASAGSTVRATSTARTSGGELARARSILAGLIKKHPVLKGSTVAFGDAKGYQAICYYKSGRIVISNTHSASLERILGHEVWHIIDWRDNGRIDWGENVPPR